MKQTTTSKLKWLAPVAGVLLSLVGATALTSCGSATDPFNVNVDFTADVKGTTINFWSPFGSTNESALEEVVSGFEKQYGVTVVLESQGSYDGLRDAISLAATNNTALPEIAFAYPDHQASYIYSDILVPLDDYFAKDGDDTFNISDFYSDYLVENQSLAFKSDGTPYTMGVPFNKSTEILSYNKTFFDWAGKKNSAIFVPTTWDEVKSVDLAINSFIAPYLGKIAGSDYVAYAKGAALPSGVTTVFDFSSVTADLFHPLSYDSQGNFFISTCRQWGGEYTTYDKEAKKGYLAFDSSEVRTGLQWMQDTYNANAIATPDDFTGESTKYSSNYFKNLMTMMMIGSSAGVINGAPSGNKFKVGIAPVPYKDADKKYVISQGTNLILLNTGDNAQRKAAWLLLKYLSKDKNGLFSTLTGYFPSCEYALQSEEYQAFLSGSLVSTADEINYAAAKVNMDTYTASGSTWHKYVDPGFVGSATIRDDVSTIMHELFNNKPQTTPDAVIKAHYAALRDYVK
jgi:multiple sugar transport system substrate-binding protein